MHILAGLDTPTSGWVEIDGTRLDQLDDRELTLHRRQRVGFIFQSYNLLPVLNAEQNILLPVRIGGNEPDREWLETLIATVGSVTGATTDRVSSPAARRSASRSRGR